MAMACRSQSCSSATICKMHLITRMAVEFELRPQQSWRERILCKGCDSDSDDNLDGPSKQTDGTTGNDRTYSARKHGQGGYRRRHGWQHRQRSAGRAEIGRAHV